MSFIITKWSIQEVSKHVAKNWWTIRKYKPTVNENRKAKQNPENTETLNMINKWTNGHWSVCLLCVCVTYIYIITCIITHNIEIIVHNNCWIHILLKTKTMQDITKTVPMPDFKSQTYVKGIKKTSFIWEKVYIKKETEKAEEEGHRGL